jgi:hypothetical protein
MGGGGCDLQAIDLLESVLKTVGDMLSVGVELREVRGVHGSDTAQRRRKRVVRREGRKEGRHTFPG